MGVQRSNFWRRRRHGENSRTERTRGVEDLVDTRHQVGGLPAHEAFTHFDVKKLDSCMSDMLVDGYLAWAG